MATVVAIGGPPGSGKTTVAALLAESLGAHLVSAGQLFREWAQERDLSLEAFGQLATEDHSIDRRLDETVAERVQELLAEGHDVVVEGRLQGHLLEGAGVDALTVCLVAPLPVRVQRIAEREEEAEEHVREEVEAREALERRRYRDLYAIDLGDTSVYDVVLDTVDRTPAQLVDRVREEVGL